MPYNERSHYDQLRASHDAALHALYGHIPVTRETRLAYARASSRAMTKLRAEDAIRDEINRIRTYVLRDSLFPSVWGSIAVEITKHTRDLTTTQRLRDDAVQRHAELLGYGLRELCTDRRANPRDRLESLLSEFHLNHLEHLEDFIEFHTDHPVTRSLGSLEELNNLRSAALHAVQSRGYEPWWASFLLFRIEYLLDADLLQREHPILWQEWIRSEPEAA